MWPIRPRESYNFPENFTYLNQNRFEDVIKNRKFRLLVLSLEYYFHGPVFITVSHFFFGNFTDVVLLIKVLKILIVCNELFPTL